MDTVNNEIAVGDDNNHGILVFSRTANGAVAPLREIRGLDTQLDYPSSVVVDVANNELWAVNNVTSDRAVVFTRAADGNATPLRIINFRALNIGRGPNLRLQLMSAGEMPLGIVYGPRAQVFKTKGAPIDWIPLEPVIVQLNPVMLASRAPNPNAAKLFIDFVLSKEAQEMIRDFNRIGPREDVPPNPPRLFQGFRYRVIDPDSYENFPQIIKLYREIFHVK